MSPYVTSAIIGSVVICALQFMGLGLDDDIVTEMPPAAVNIAHR